MDGSTTNDKNDIFIEIPVEINVTTAPPSNHGKDEDNHSDSGKKDPFDIGIQHLTPFPALNYGAKRMSTASGKMGDYYNSEKYNKCHGAKGHVVRSTSVMYSSMTGVSINNDGTLELALASANSQVSELRSENQNLQYRVQFLEGELLRHQHQIGTCKAQYKALQSEVFELQTAKELYGENNQDMLAEKEELQQEMTEAIMSEREKVQTVQLQLMDLNIQLDKSAMELANKDRLLTQVMNENNKLKRYRQEMRESDSGQKDVQVKLFHCEKQKATLEREKEKLTDMVEEKDEELKKLKDENAKISEALKKYQLEAGTVGAFMTALAHKKKSESASPEDRHKSVNFNMTNRPDNCSLGETLTEVMRATLQEEGSKSYDDSDNEVGIELSENLHLKVVHVDNVEEALSIEREGLRALVVEGMVIFEELYNSYRVMQHIGYEDAKTAAKMMIEQHNYNNNVTDDGGYHTDRHHSPTTNRIRTEQYNGVVPQQLMTCSGGTKGCYFTSWYCQKGPELMIAWLKCLNLYSPSLVNMLLNAGFWDMHSLVHITDADMQALHIVTGIRRKLLSGIDELREKTKIVTEETLAILRDTYCISEERYLMERERRSEEGSLRGPNGAMKKKMLERAKKDMMDTARQLPYDDDMPQGMDYDDYKQHNLVNTTKGGGEKKVVINSNIKKAAPIVIAELLKDMHAWFSDVRVSIDGNEVAVKRALEVNSTR